MATQTMAAADAALKVGYGKLHEQLRDEIPLWQSIESTSEHITAGNQEVQFALHTTRNRGQGARNEMEDLPTAGRQGYKRAKLFLKNYYQGISVSGQTFEEATSNPQAFLDVVDGEVKGAFTDLKIDLNRGAYGDGSATLALCSGSNADTTQLVDSVHFLMEGDVIDIVDASALPTVTLLYTGITITAIDEDTEIVTMSVSVTTADGDIIVRSGNYGGKEIDGLSSLIGIQDLHDVTVATTSVWKSYVRTSVGDLEQIDMLRAVQNTARHGGTPTRIFTDYESFNSYWDLFEDYRRFTNDAPSKGGQNVEMSFRAGKLGNIPITPDFDAPPGTMFFVDENELVLNQAAPLQWMNRDGNMWKQIPNKDGYQAWLYWYGNLGTYRRNTSAKLTGINPLT